MKRFIFLCILLCGIHGVGLYQYWMPENLRLILLADISTCLIFVVSILVGFPGIRKSPEEFVLRFLVLTTFQLLTELVLIVVLIVRHKAEVRVLALSLAALFIVLLAIQSVELIKAIRQKDQA